MDELRAGVLQLRPWKCVKPLSKIVSLYPPTIYVRMRTASVGGIMLADRQEKTVAIRYYCGHCGQETRTGHPWVGISPRTREGGSAISIVFGLFMICLAMLLAVGGLVLVQRLVPIEVRQPHNDVAGFIYAVVGVAYAVLLGLILIAVWEQFSEARETAEREASQVADVFWLAHRMPEP